MFRRRASFRAALLSCLLLSAGCFKESLDAQLLRAAKLGDSEKAAALIKRGARVDAVDEDGWAPLLWAAAHGNEGTLTVLLDAGADREAATRRERQGALTLAAKWNRVGVVELLLRRGLSPRSRDNIGWSALMWASLLGRTDVVKALLNAGAAIETVDSDGNTPLILAARRGRVETVRFLLARGAAPGAANADGQTARSLALSTGHPEVAVLLNSRP